MNKEVFESTFNCNDYAYAVREEISEAITPLVRKYLDDGMRVSDFYYLVIKELETIFYDEFVERNMDDI